MTIQFKNGGKRRQPADSGLVARAARPAAPSTLAPQAPVRPNAIEVKPTAAEVTRQSIAEAAYFLWLQRGGDEVLNWLEAEKALKFASFGVPMPK